MTGFHYGKFLAGITLLILLLCAIPLVSADEIYPTITDVFFEKDGVPWNEPVQFTVNCYGYGCKSWDCQRDPLDLAAQNGNYSPELYFSYHATIPTYGSRIYEPYYHAGRGYTDYCNLEGVTKGQQFSIRNFSPSPLPENCTELNQFHMGGSGGTFWNGTPEYDVCVNATRLEREECYDYVAICDPQTDRECRGWVHNGNNVKDTTASRACEDRVDKERTACDRFLQPVDPATMVMWKDPRGESEWPAMRSCGLRFSIPADTPPMTSSPSHEVWGDPVPPVPNMTFGKRAVATAEYFDPIATLYCTMNFFGAKC
jgi:hypothetical protein